MVIGITGGIGSGKSAVSQYLISIGEQVLCADDVARQVVMPGEFGSSEIQRVFGSSFFATDGSLDRKMLANIVFADENKLAKLNSILHPIIIERLLAQADKLTGRVFLDVALLIKADMQNSVDYIWLITADKNERIRRVMQRDGASRQSVLARMNRQLSDDQMRPYANEVIENNESLPQLCAKIEELLAKPIYDEVIDE